MDSNLFSGKVYVVTGGGGGIGFGIVRQLEGYGAHVFALDLRKENPASFEELDKNRTTFIEVDVSDREACSNAIDRVLSKHDRIDGLVNNAGVCPSEGELPDPKLFRSVIDVNLGGAFNMGSLVLPKMKEQKSGVIVNVGSTSCLSGKNRLPLYASSKHALLGLTRSWALDFAKYGIRVNCVGPGATDTAMARAPLQTVMGPRFGPGKTDDELLECVAASIPLGRIGTVDDVAHSVNFLLSDLSSFITGQIIVVSGGSS
ncbi:hypothetical protein KCU98_g1335, partial [Aureobasidium melanogenum]